MMCGEERCSAILLDHTFPETVRIENPTAMLGFPLRRDRFPPAMIGLPLSSPAALAVHAHPYRSHYEGRIELKTTLELLPTAFSKVDSRN